MNALPEDLLYLTAGHPAKASVVFNASAPVSGTSTITVNGVAYTYGTDWSSGAGSVEAYNPIRSAREFCTLINGVESNASQWLSGDPAKDVFARTFGSKVLLYARVPGTDGNSLTLATNKAASFTVSGATFSGGSEGAAGTALGAPGALYITDTSAHAGDFVAIQALADTVIAAMTSSNWTGTLTNIPLPAGVVIYSRVSSITLTSGTVVAYRH